MCVVKHLTVAFLVGLGISACSSDDGEQPEPVQAEEGSDSVAADSEGNQDGAVASGGEGAALEGEAVEDAELTTPADGEAPPADAFGAEEPAVEPQPDPAAAGDDTQAMFSEPPMPSDVAADPEAAAPDLGASEPLPEAAAEPVAASGGAFGGSVVQSPGAKWTPGAGAGPTGSPAAGGMVGSYTVRPGDSLSGISQKLYGTPARYQELAAANAMQPPYTIFPGQTLSYPTDGGAAPASGNWAAAEGAPDKTLVVKAGDTLWHLAKKHLGNAYAWRLFVDWNPGVLSNPNQISPGMKLAYGKLHGVSANSNSVGGTKAKAVKHVAKKVQATGGTNAATAKAPKPQAAAAVSEPAAVDSAVVPGESTEPTEPTDAETVNEPEATAIPTAVEEPIDTLPEEEPPVETTVNDEVAPEGEAIYDTEESE